MSTNPSDIVSPMDGFWNDTLAQADPEIAEAVGKELGRQRDKIELIASENIASRAVLEATGSVFTNKYAEGYPGKRYYGGCDYADVVETLAIERAKQLFGCNFANVQPNSGGVYGYNNVQQKVDYARRSVERMDAAIQEGNAGRDRRTD